MGKSAPKPPDPARQAEAQAAANRETAITQAQLNMVNQVTPWGTVTYEQTGQQLIPGTGGGLSGMFGGADGEYTPTYTATTTLSPEQQAIFDQSQRAQGNLAGIAADQSAFLQDYLGQQIDVSGAPGLQSTFGPDFNTQFGGDLGLQTSYAPEDGFSADRQRVEDALWQRGASDRAAAEAQMRSTLQAKGIREGSAAWNQEMERMARQNTDARLATLLAGGQEQSRLLGEARAAGQFGNQALLAQGQFGQQAQQLQNAAAAQQAGFGNQARAQYLQEAYQRRNQPLNEIAALLSGSQVQNPAQMGAAVPQTSVANTNVAQLQQNAYENQLGQYQSQMTGLGRLMGTGLGLFFSDRRLKRNVSRIGTTAGGTPVYTYQYIWGGPFHVGVMADEVPHAVVKHSSGFDMVDYARVA